MVIQTRCIPEFVHYSRYVSDTKRKDDGRVTLCEHFFVFAVKASDCPPQRRTPPIGKIHVSLTFGLDNDHIWIIGPNGETHSGIGTSSHVPCAMQKSRRCHQWRPFLAVQNALSHFLCRDYICPIEHRNRIDTSGTNVGQLSIYRRLIKAHSRAFGDCDRVRARHWGPLRQA